MDSAKWTGHAGTDQWNIGVTHNDKKVINEPCEDNPIRGDRFSPRQEHRQYDDQHHRSDKAGADERSWRRARRVASE